MRRRIDTSQGIDLTLIPDGVEKEILQNIYCILNTPKGSVPCYRDFGVDNSYLHRPMNAAQAAYMVAISEAITRFEPRVTINRITFRNDPVKPDTLYPVLEVTFLES